MIPPVALAAGVSVAPYGVTSAGEAVDRVTLRNARGTTVAVLTLGGIIDRVLAADRRGRRANVVLALPDVAAHERRANFGSLIGRYAGRISGGGFAIDGQRYALSPDPAAIVSHGGTPGFGAKLWRAEPCTTPKCSAVTLRYASPDGENGFPGALTVSVTYTLAPDDTLRLDYRATTTRATVVNLTHHAYWTLGGGGTIERQYLLLPGDRVLELDARRVPTGAALPVAGTPFDFRRPARIGERVAAPHPQMRLARGLDHFFPSARAGLPAACAYDPASGRTLIVRTTAPGVQIYTGNAFDGSLRDAAGRPIGPHAGLAIEAQAPPDAPNRPEFASTVLRPGETWRVTTRFRLGTAPSLAAFARACRRTA